MTDPEALLRRVTLDLRSLGTDWAVIGALAVGARSEPRFTRDVDLAIAVKDDAEAEDLIRDLRERGYSIHTVLEQEHTGRLATVRLVPKDADPDEPVLDLLFASSGIEPEIVSAAEEIELFPDQSVPVALRGHLIALKVLASAGHRPHDEIDLWALLQRAGPDDLLIAREAAHLITERGYSRGRNLTQALDEAIARRQLDP